MKFEDVEEKIEQGYTIEKANHISAGFYVELWKPSEDGYKVLEYYMDSKKELEKVKDLMYRISINNNI